MMKTWYVISESRSEELHLLEANGDVEIRSEELEADGDVVILETYCEELPLQEGIVIIYQSIILKI